jgi:hypothetical protein
MIATFFSTKIKHFCVSVKKKKLTFGGLDFKKMFGYKKIIVLTDIMGLHVNHDIRDFDYVRF